MSSIVRRTRLGAATVIAMMLSSTAAAAQAQSACPEHTFDACAIRLQDERLILRGAAAQPIGKLGWRGDGLALALAESDSAARYARAFTVAKKRGLALSLYSSMAGTLVGSHIHSIRDAKWVAVGASAIVGTLAGSFYSMRAQNAAQKAIWWYNRDVTNRPTQIASSFPVDSLVLGPLRQVVDATPGAGVVIGLVDRDGSTRVVTRGTSGREGVPLDSRTVFEIGSLTKLFTADVLAAMATAHEVMLSDPLERYLPAHVRVPSLDGRSITLLDLATHRSGLPRLPTNLVPADSANPYAAYDEPRLFSFLASYELSRAPGAAFEYSNVGYGLLGDVLRRRAGTSYAALVQTRLLAPLGMNDTRIILDSTLGARLAAGHAQSGRVASNWDLGVLEGAGAYRSTMYDLLLYAKANLRTHDVGVSTSLTHGADSLALGWQVTRTPSGRRIQWKDGETGGYAAFIGLDVDAHRAVVMLANVAGAESLDAIGLELLQRETAAPVATSDVPSDSTLRSYVGEYDLSPTFGMSVTLNGRALHVQGTGQGRLDLLPRAADTFDVVGVAARVSFSHDAAGRVVSLTLMQNGSSAVARRRR